ncbi:MAG: hypothetical protein WBD36_05870, partial [Bacteroidota bacterium]
MNVFERNPKKTILFIVLVGVVLVLSVAEVSLRVFLGLGHPVLYRSSPLFGYRLQPHQHLYRRGCEIQVNNLALRADRDWDSNIENKVLFLGNSVTYGGTYISNDHLFSHLAVRGLNGYVAGNAGVNGWGIENISALVVDYGFLPSRIYVTVLQETDFYRGLSKLSGKPFWTANPTFALQELLGIFYARQLEGMYENHERFVDSRERQKTVERSCSKLKELDKFIKSKGYYHLVYFSTSKAQLLDRAPIDTLVTEGLIQTDIKITYVKDRPEITSLSKRMQQDLFFDSYHLN